MSREETEFKAGDKVSVNAFRPNAYSVFKDGPQAHMNGDFTIERSDEHSVVMVGEVSNFYTRKVFDAMVREEMVWKP